MNTTAPTPPSTARFHRVPWIFLVVTIAVGFLLFAACGCRTSPERAAINSAATVVTSVDTAMTGWGEWVVAERTRIKAIPDQLEKLAAAKHLAQKEVRVSTVYEAYLVAITTAISVGASTNGVPTIPGPALTKLITVINLEQL